MNTAPRRVLRPVSALAGLLVVAGSLLAGGTATATSQHEGHRLNHVFVIFLENNSRRAVIGSPNAPFLTGLASTYGQATRYFGVTHPSLPNYVATLSGSNWFVNDDNPKDRFDHTNLVDQLESHHLTWAAYMDAMPRTGFLGKQWPSYTALYANKHNPFVLFSDIRRSPSRLANVKPYTDFAGDLSGWHVPNFVFISPDQCNDMHGGVYVSVPGHPETPCPYPGSNRPRDPAQTRLVRQADDFVNGAVTTIMSSPSWREGSAIFIVSDEGSYDNNGDHLQNDGWMSAANCCDSPFLPPGYQFLDSHGSPDGNVWPGGTYGGGNVPAIVVTSDGPRGVVSDMAYNHYSLLRTIEANWELGYLGNASDTAQVHAMTDLLGG
jgi:phosphatidylinositol-3-phosphatase